MSKYIAVDLFSGCGGLTVGLKKSGFEVAMAVDSNPDAVEAYRLNHPECCVILKDIRAVPSSFIREKTGKEPIHLLSGCPPCQGFASVRRLNRKRNVQDKRNSLIMEFLRLVEELEPLTIMMENVRGLINYYRFEEVLKKLDSLGYYLNVEVVDAKNYGIPQGRKRLVLLGSKFGKIEMPEGNYEKVTVRDTIAGLESTEETNDPLQKIKAEHTDRIRKMIELVPKDGGSRRNLPEEYILDCHKEKNVGFNDIYGRLRWDDCSSTITGGCLNPSKGRFLHPEENRCITPREALLLQSFPKDYKLPGNLKKGSIASLIGNALPPKLSYIFSKAIKDHLDKHLA